MHRREECEHGFLYVQCRCPGNRENITTVPCEKITNHDQKLAKKLDSKE